MLIFLEKFELYTKIKVLICNVLYIYKKIHIIKNTSINKLFIKKAQ